MGMIWFKINVCLLTYIPRSGREELGAMYVGLPGFRRDIFRTGSRSRRQRPQPSFRSTWKAASHSSVMGGADSREMQIRMISSRWFAELTEKVVTFAEEYNSTLTCRTKATGATPTSPSRVHARTQVGRRLYVDNPQGWKGLSMSRGRISSYQES